VIITAKARENQLFNDIVKVKDIDGKDYGFTRTYHNINKILWQLPNATGVKTGSTGDAGKCLVTSVQIQDNDVIIVVLNSPPRWKETIKIHDYVAKNFTYKNFFKKGDILGEVPVENEREKVRLITNEDIVIPIKSGSSYEAQVIKPNYKVIAPISKGTAIGNISIYEDGKKIFSKQLEADNGVKKHGILRKWKVFR
jgi:D-alanyl-D-alanine carboxypeptidase